MIKRKRAKCKNCANYWVCPFYKVPKLENKGCMSFYVYEKAKRIK